MTTETLTRERLYALVWETPMSKLAPTFGLSDNGLAKICRANDIPYPPRGYWAKKEAGQHVAQTPLRKTKGKAGGKTKTIKSQEHQVKSQEHQVTRKETTGQTPDFERIFDST